MKRALLLIVALMLPGGSLAGEHLAADEVRSVGGSLAWNVIRVGATRAEVERALHRTLPVHRADFTLVCGEFESQTEVEGHSVVIRWSGPELSGTVDSILVPLAQPEADLTASALSARISKRWPGLQPRMVAVPSDGFAGLSLVPDRRLVVLVNAREHYLFVSSEACVD